MASLAWLGRTRSGSHCRNRRHSGRCSRRKVSDCRRGTQGGAPAGRSRDLCVRTIQHHHRLRDSPPPRRTDFDGDHREHGAMAAASANECPTANALVSAGGSFDAESPDLRRERYPQPGLCHRGALGAPPVSESRLTCHVLDGLVGVWRSEPERGEHPSIRSIPLCNKAEPAQASNRSTEQHIGRVSQQSQHQD